MTQKELTDLLDNASRLYYNGQQSPLTDTEFDLLLKDLQKMEKDNRCVYPNSPTKRVGSDIQDGFKKGTHPKPMFTIENAYDNDGVSEWIKKMIVSYDAIYFSVTPKYDGISCELHYKEGVLVQALTRGDKLVGDDITENVKTIYSIPLTINEYPFNKGDFYVRGEVLMPKSRLAVLNEERINNGEQPFANTRNACSGSLKQLDPKVTAGRGLIFRAWECFGDFYNEDSMTIRCHDLEKIGFFFEDGTKAEYADSRTVLGNVARMKERLSSLDFDCDGVVIKLDNIAKQELIGSSDERAIGWAIARKWNEEYIVKTKLLDVDWQVGRTGVLTPVGRLQPVECGGVVITNVTLNNEDFITSLGLRYGDMLKITRSGGVIPYVLDAEHGEDSGDEVSIPDVCPECGMPVVKEGALLKCKNNDCHAIVKGKILQFCSKDCMDIRSIGESVVDDLYEKLGVRKVSDLYHLNEIGVDSIIESLGEGYGKKKVQKILDEIEKSKQQPWDRVLAALSIPGVGKVVARNIAKVYSAMLLSNLSEAELSRIEGIGPIMAHDIREWWQDEGNRAMYLDLVRSGLYFNKEHEHRFVTLDSSENKLDGLVVCFTGSSSKFSGDKVEEFLEENGAKCTHSVSKKMNYLITGSKPGASKVKKAEELGVEIIGEEEFYQKYGL